MEEDVKFIIRDLKASNYNKTLIKQLEYLLQAYREKELIIDKLVSFIFHEHYKMTYVDEKQFEDRKKEIIRNILEIK